MADKEHSPDNLARKTFLITVVGALLYITVVFTFVIGGNKREEAHHVDETGAIQMQTGHAP